MPDEPTNDNVHDAAFAVWWNRSPGCQERCEGLTRAAAIQPTVFHNPEAARFEMYVVMDTAEEEVVMNMI